MMFYKETNFKETPIGKIPKDWEVVKLGEVLLLLRNGLTANQNKEEKGYPVTRIETISEEKIDSSKLGFVPKLTAKEIEEYKLIEGDILFSHINSLEHIGKTAIYEGMPEPLFHGMNLLLLRPAKNKVHPKYLLYLLRLFRTRKIFWAMSKKAVNQASINQSELGRLRIVLPPLLEQQKIAEVLSTVDEAIRRTDEVIAKTERLKKGLMQELFTKGIGHKEFKDTEIGRIPKDWEVVRVNDILSLEYGKGLPERKRVQGEYPVVGSNGIVGYHNQALVKRPGIVIGRKGTIGAVSWIDQDFWPIDTTYYVKLKLLNINWRWLFYELTYLNPARFHLSDVVPGLKRELVHSLKMPLPHISEQQKIAEILSTIDKKLELERNEKARLERIKQGLMDLLLTGKIRVKGN